MIDNNVTIPEKKKRPAWTRILDIVLRTAHVAGTSVLFGGAICGVSLYRLYSWHFIALVTGCGLIASEIYHNRHWLYQGRGVMVLIHVGLLGVIRLQPDLLKPILTVVLISGMAGSHMPKKFRYWSFIHRQVMD
jgi:hypothetical protein